MEQGLQSSVHMYLYKRALQFHHVRSASARKTVFVAMETAKNEMKSVVRGTNTCPSRLQEGSPTLDAQSTSQRQ